MNSDHTDTVQHPRRHWLAAAGATLAAGLVPLSAGAGTPGVDEPPLPQPPRPLVLPPIVEQRLPNGLGLVVLPQPALPLVSAMLLVRAGPERDPAGQPGVAQMTAALLTKGARRGGRAVGAPELARQAEALGGSLDSACNWGATTLAMTVTTPRLPAALALLADVLRQPLLAADELERARAQTLDGLRVAFSDPGAMAGMLLRRGFWGDTPHGAVGTPATVQRLKLDALRAFHARHYRPERCTLLLAGDITTAQAQALARRLLGDWRAPAAAPPLAASVPAQARGQTPPLVLLDMPGSGQSGVAVAAPFVGAEAADRRIGLVANAVLGGGYSARLNQEVRIKRGLSYGVGATVEAHAGGGMWSASAQTNHPTAAQVLQLLREQLLTLADNPPSPDELAARQATLVGSFARRLDTPAGVAGLAIGQIVQGRPLAELATFADTVMAVTPAQVADFARRHWRAASVRAVVAGDLGAAGDSLAAVSADALRLTMDGLDLAQAGLVRR